ncbi:MAG: cytochrome c oxidase assembly protein [Pseudomonadota bacterium]
MGSDRWLPVKLIAMTGAAFAFSYSLVPLYDVFCELTGYGGRTNEAPVAVVEAADTERTVTIQFTTTVNESAPYTFEAEVTRLEVQPGKLYNVEFLASNLTGDPRIAQAIPSVYPNKAGSYLRKTECFCFNNQPFAGQETKEMPVRFMIDRSLPSYIDTITLAYTFFDIDTSAGD